MFLYFYLVDSKNACISMNGVKISIHSFLTYLIDFLKTRDINNSAICLQNNLFITFCLSFLIQPNYLYRSQKPIQSAHTKVRSVKANLHITFIDYPIRLTTEQNMMTRSNLFAYKISIFVQFGKYVEEFLKKIGCKIYSIEIDKGLCHPLCRNVTDLLNNFFMYFMSIKSLCLNCQIKHIFL